MCFRFLFAHGFEHNVHELDKWQTHLENYTVDGENHTRVSLDQLFLPCDNRQPPSLSAQFTLLSCVNNYHWGCRPKCVGKGITSEHSHIPTRSRFSYVPRGQDIGGRKSSGHLPNSSRNLVIHFSCSPEHADFDQVRINMRHLIQPYKSENYLTADVDMTNVLPKPKRLRGVRGNDSCEFVADSAAPNTNMAGFVHKKLYASFLEHMMSAEATLLWRCHTNEFDIFVMNDINSQTGIVLPSCIVHVTRRNMRSEVRYSCTCQLYAHIESSELTAGENEPFLTEQDVSFRPTCAHCRFLKENIEEHIPSLFEDSVPKLKIQTQLLKAKEGLLASVIQVGTFSTQTTVKFSVLPQNNTPSDETIPDCAFVHLTRYGYLACQSGGCKAKVGITRGVKKLESLFTSSRLCTHLACIAANRDVVMAHYVNRKPSATENMDDVDLMEELVRKFNIIIFFNLWLFLRIFLSKTLTIKCIVVPFMRRRRTQPFGYYTKMVQQIEFIQTFNPSRQIFLPKANVIGRRSRSKIKQILVNAIT